MKPADIALLHVLGKPSVSPDGGHAVDCQPVQVTSGDFDHACVTWSQDGQDLAFVAARHDTRDTDLVTDIWLCATDGSHLRPITRGATADRPRLSIDQVRFTPDGTSVCFTAADVGTSGREISRNNGVWSVPADGSTPPRRLTDAETIQCPDPSDGTWPGLGCGALPPHGAFWALSSVKPGIHRGRSHVSARWGLPRLGRGYRCGGWC